MILKYKPFLRALSSVLGNISAGWFGLALITPNFASLSNIDGQLTLTKDILLGIVFLIFTTTVERQIKK